MWTQKCETKNTVDVLGPYISLTISQQCIKNRTKTSTLNVLSLAVVILSILDGIFIECLLLGVCAANGKMKMYPSTSTKTKDYVPIQKLKKERVSLQQRPGEISPTVCLFV